jgi:hypothetical protein
LDLHGALLAPLEDVSERILVELVREPQEGNAWLVPTLLYRAGKEAKIRGDYFGCHAEGEMRQIEVGHLLAGLRAPHAVRVFETEFEERNSEGMFQYVI